MTNELPDAPSDPRQNWDLSAFGELPVVAEVSELATRVLAPNPSPMTLDGTNTYVIGEDASGAAVVLDPGPRDDDHRRHVEEVLGARAITCELVLVTHHHEDHAAAAQDWAGRFDCVVAAPTRAVAGDDGRLVEPGDRIEVGGVAIDAVATPGHTRDHTSFRTPDGALFTGDHVLGRGTSVVAHPDGNLGAYLESLRRVLELGPDVLFPGHGPVLAEDPTAVIDYYLAHREHRLQQILAALGSSGRLTPRQLVERIYADVDRRLWPAAEASTSAALELLSDQERIAWDGEAAWLP